MAFSNKGCIGVIVYLISYFFNFYIVMPNFFKNYFSGYHKLGGIKELLAIALPMIVSTACDGAMTFTDRLFLAKVGSEQMNAALGGGVTMQMLMFFFVGLTGYSTALVAQYFGAGEKHNSSKAAFQAILITVLAWPVILILKPLVVSFYHFSDISQVQLGYQVQYLNILAWGGLFGLLRYTLGCYFSGIGKTQIVMKATLAALVINVILDYLLIFGKFGFPSLGIQGAAIATVCGALGALIILVLTYFQKKNVVEFSVFKSFHFDWDIMKKLIKFGYPAGLELFLLFCAMTMLVTVFHSKGEVIATASTIMFNWDLVSFIPLLGIEIAVTSLVGRYMGAGRPQVAHRAALSGVKSGFFYSIVILFLFLLIPESLVRVFSPEGLSSGFEETVPIAVAMIRIAAIYVLAEAIMVAIIGALRGAGDTMFTMIASVTAHWVLVPILYLSLHVFNISVVLSWFLMVIIFMVFCGVLYLRFQGGRWKQIKVIEVEAK